MGMRLFHALSRRHHLLPETAGAPLKATLRKTETARKLGRAIARVQQTRGLSLKEFAATLEVDERQLARWMNADERPQIETVLAVEEFASAMAIAIAEQVSGLTIETVVRMAR